MTQPTTQLPNKLSALLRLAVQDAQKCEAMPERYYLDMSIWHEPRGPLCAVCMAGAVIAQTLESSPVAQKAPAHFGAETWSKLMAINALRQGDLDGAASRAQLDEPPSVVSRRFADIINLSFLETDDRASWEDYLKAADLLEEAGL